MCLMQLLTMTGSLVKTGKDTEDCKENYREEH